MNPNVISRFQQLYHQLNKNAVHRHWLEDIYDNGIQFHDPFHHIEGLDDLNRYFSEMYSNIEEIRFEFGTVWHQTRSESSQDHAFIRWQMSYIHPRINTGQPVQVDGGSELIWHNEKIVYHRDFFDAGQMLYEHLPVIGWAIRKLKERMI